jgi:pimeloyl-ACP methyl ester carboxylesterase
VRRPDRGDDLTTPLGSGTPVAGGRDLFLPGNDLRLAATRWAGTGTPILLLHGLASQRRFWNLVATDLAGRPVCALDQRGHGDSDKPDDGYDLSTVAADAATALDALGWSRAVVVGHSWGAAVATTLAAEHPERVLAVVAVDGGVGSPAGDEPREEVRKRLEPPRFAVPPDELVPMLRQGALAPWWSPAVEDAVLPIFAVGDDGLARARLTFERHMRIVDGLLDYDADAVFARIAAPCWLVVADSGDEWSERKKQGLEHAVEALARPRAFTLRGALHDVPLQWPAVVSGVVRAAADEVAAAAREGRA